MTHAMIWTFGILGFIVLLSFANRSWAHPKAPTGREVSSLRDDLARIEGRLVEIEAILRDVD